MTERINIQRLRKEAESALAEAPMHVGWKEALSWDDAARLYAEVLALVEAIEAARTFTDEQSCLDDTCTHRICRLNKALARFDFGLGDA